MVSITSHRKVRAEGNNIFVFVNQTDTPRIIEKVFVVSPESKIEETYLDKNKVVDLENISEFWLPKQSFSVLVGSAITQEVSLCIEYEEAPL